MNKIKHFFINILWPTVKRFPITILSGLIMSGLMIYSIKKNIDPSRSSLEETVFALLMIFVLAVLFSFSTKMFYESKNWPIKYKIFIPLIPTIILITYFIKIKYFLDIDNQKTGVEFGLIALSLTALITFAPLIPQKLNYFWILIQTFVKQLLLTGLFTAIAWIGLNLALMSLSYLFAINIEPEKYFDVIAILLGIFSIPFFLTGIPKLSNLEAEIKYSKWLKFCSKFILTPLLAIYFVILYAYTFKVIFFQVWPKDGIVFWIMLYISLALVIYFFTRPLLDKAKHKLISYGFTLTSIPLYIIYFIAIILRINQYGLTISRYLVVLFAVWSISLIAYFTFSRKKYLMIIPASIILASLIFLYGPWSSYNLSFISQINRYEQLLMENNLILDGKLQPQTEEMPSDTYFKIQDETRYILRSFDSKKFNQWLGEDNVNLIETNSGKDFKLKYDYQKVTIFFNGLNIKTDKLHQTKNNHFNFNSSKSIFPISGYDYFIDINSHFISETNSDFPTNYQDQNIKIELSKNTVYISDLKKQLIKIDLGNKILPLITFSKPPTLNAKELTFEAENDNIKLLLIITHASLESTADDDIKIISLKLDMAYSLK